MTHFYPILDPRKIPFSAVGSYLTLNQISESLVGQVRLNTVRRAAATPRWQPGKDWSNEVADFSLENAAGQTLTSIVTASPDQLALIANVATASFVYADADTLVVRVSNAALRIAWQRNFAWKLPVRENVFFAYDARSLYHVSIRASEHSTLRFLEGPGTDAPGAPAGGVANDSILVRGATTFEVTLRFSLFENREPPAIGVFVAAHRARAAEIETWQKARPTTPAEFENPARIGWYLFWNLQVYPSGRYTRTSILSSKRSMSMLWTWDNCFNALACVRTQLALAWDQIFVVFDQQLPNGLLPDVLNDAGVMWGYTKPPVIGFTVHRLLAQTPIARRKSYAEKVYEPLQRVHNWWLRERDLTGNGLLFYMDGNDSGWDNASVFDQRWPVALPDLTAFLILQAEALSELATLLDRGAEAEIWLKQSRELLQRFHAHFVRDDEFVHYVLTPEGTQLRRGDQCLLTRIPIVLGHRLPAPVRRRLIAELGNEKTFLSAYGPASEALNSAKYEPNGYWRGPVWGPSTYLIFEGLLACEERSAAREIALRFCRLCSRTAIFSENYNALTGADQYDCGMTWSSADFLLLAQWLAENPE